MTKGHSSRRMFLVQTTAHDYLDLDLQLSLNKRRVPLEPGRDVSPASFGKPMSNQNGSAFDSHAPLSSIMVVDDEPDMVSVLKYALQQNGFRVDGYTDPIEALRAFRAHQYDVVLLDIRMPKMNGIELYRRIRSLDNEVVICFVSAYEQYKREFEIAHPEEKTSCFIPKPFRIDSLVSMIVSKVEDRRHYLGSKR